MLSHFHLLNDAFIVVRPGVEITGFSRAIDAVDKDEGYPEPDIPNDHSNTTSTGEQMRYFCGLIYIPKTNDSSLVQPVGFDPVHFNSLVQQKTESARQK